MNYDKLLRLIEITKNAITEAKAVKATLPNEFSSEAAKEYYTGSFNYLIADLEHQLEELLKEKNEHDQKTRPEGH